MGYEGDLKKLDKAQEDALAARSPALVKALLKTPEGPVAFTHVRAFVDGTHFEDDQTVVVNNGLIAQVGPASSTAAPTGALVIDGNGKTLIPGLWDSHMHVQDDSAGPFLLALGIILHGSRRPRLKRTVSAFTSTVMCLPECAHLRQSPPDTTS